jgi:hypothetical protein
MADKKWIVNLNADEREQLRKLIRQGKAGGRTLNRAQVLLLADEGWTAGRLDSWTEDAIVAALHTSVSTVERTRRRCVEGGVEHALREKARPKRGTKLDGKGRAILVATACSQPPEGRATWTMQLLADRLVELKVVECISDETVRTELKKMT